MESQILTTLLRSLIGIIIAYFVLRVLFKGSIIMKVGIIIVAMVMLQSYITRLVTSAVIPSLVSCILTFVFTIGAVYIIYRDIKTPFKKSN